MKYTLALFLLVAIATGSVQAQPSTPPLPIASAESSAPGGATALAPGDVAKALRQGGYVIYFRHTATDFSKDDTRMKNYADCANQRLLSAQGRSTATAIGRHIQALKLPVTEAFASPLCRTMYTATLMFKNVTPKNEMREGDSGDYPGLKRLLAAPIAAGSNRWLIGHGTPFRAVAGAPHLAEGEAAVIRPGSTHWTVVARLQPADWAALQ